jgi:hypothetical protein
MPFSRLHVPESLSVETCRSINACLHASLVETCGVHPDDDFCLVSRYAPDDMMFHPAFLGRRDPRSSILIEITLLRGRDEHQKEALYADVRRRLDGIGFDAANAIIFLTENRAIDWSFSAAGSVKTVLGLP